MVCTDKPKDTTDWTPLFWPSYNGDEEGVVSLLDAGVDYFDVDSSGRTALHWAIVQQQKAIVKILLSHHEEWLSEQKRQPLHTLTYAQIAGPGRKMPGVTAIELAAEVGNEEIFSLVLDHFELSDGSTVQFNSLWTALPPNHDSESRDWLDIEFIEERRQLVRSITPRNNIAEVQSSSVLLHLAIMDNKFPVFNMLLRQGIDPDVVVNRGITPLHNAALFRTDVRYVRILLEHGANPTCQHYVTGLTTPLGLAIVNGFEDAVTALLEAGVSANGLEGTRPPLYIACEYMRCDPPVLLRVVRKLLDAGADVNGRPANEYIPLRYAAQRFHLSVVKELVSRGGDAAAVDGDGRYVYNYLAGGICDDEDDVRRCKDILNYLMQCLAINNDRVHNVLQKASTATWDVLVEAGFAFQQPMDLCGQLAYAVEDHNIHGVIYLLDSQCCNQPREFGQYFTIFVRGALMGSCNTKPGYHPKTPDSFHSILFLLWNAGLVTSQDTAFALLYVIPERRNARIQSAEKLLMVEALLQCGADRYALGGWEWNIGGGLGKYDSIALSAIYGYSDILSLLLRDRPDPPTPSHWLCPFDTVRQSSPDDATAVFTCLKMHGLLEPPKVRAVKWSPLFLAIDSRNPETVRRILSVGGDVNMDKLPGWEDEYHHWTLLHRAILSDCEETVEILLRAGVNANAFAFDVWGLTVSDLKAPNFDPGWTPLHMAVVIGNKSIVEKLLDFGAAWNWKFENSVHYSELPPTLTALRLALDVPRPGGRSFYPPLKAPLDPARLSIAQLLVDRGADTRNVAAHLSRKDVMKFKGFESLWDTLRAGIILN